MSDLEGWSRVIEENDDQEDKEKQSKSKDNNELRKKTRTVATVSAAQ